MNVISHGLGVFMNNEDEGRHMPTGNDDKKTQNSTIVDGSKIDPVQTIMRSVKEAGVDLVLHLPCDHIHPLLNPLVKEIKNIPLTREEEGVGIAAGASLAGKRPLMVIQNSGIGNMINALLSLTTFYEFPLPIFVSHPGLEDEMSKAQVPMGSRFIAMLDALCIEHHSYLKKDDLIYKERSDYHDNSREIKTSNEYVNANDPSNECCANDRIIPETIKDLLLQAYDGNKIIVFLFSPQIWQGLWTGDMIQPGISQVHRERIVKGMDKPASRIVAIKKLNPFLKEKAVVCNMGFPSRELFHVSHQPSNFYMLGSLGMASSIGLGLAISCDRKVVVLDGDGSLLTNPNALVSIGGLKPKNLTIIALDNGRYGSIGNQLTHVGRGLPLEELAMASGIPKILVTDDPRDVVKYAIREGPWFIRLKVKPGNAHVNTVPLSGRGIKRDFMDWLSGRFRQDD